jgi:hypothetical protein
LFRARFAAVPKIDPFELRNLALILVFVPVIRARETWACLWFEPNHLAFEINLTFGFWTLTFDIVSYHLISELAQVSPPPKAVRQIKSAPWMLPSRTAESKVMGTVAEEILANFSIVKQTFSMGTFNRFAMACSIRRLAWWGMIHFTSDMP